MHQFDICTLRKPRSQSTYVVVLQHAALDDLRTVLAAPLQKSTITEPRPRLRPSIWLGDTAFSLAVDKLAVIDRSERGYIVGSAAGSADAIKRAVDVAFFGN